MMNEEKEKQCRESLDNLYTINKVDLNDVPAKIEFLKLLFGGQTNVSYMGMHKDTVEEQNALTLRVLEHEYLIDAGVLVVDIDYTLH